MNSLKIIYTLTTAFLVSISSFASSELTRSDLLEGIKIPDKRSFQTSDKISACEDFHKYACSVEETKFKLPSDRSIWFFSFSDNAERILHAKKVFFKKMSKGLELKEKRISQVQNFYLACMDVPNSKKSEKNYVTTLEANISNLKTTADFKTYIEKNLLNGNFSPLAFSNIPNAKNPKRDDILLMTTFMGLPDKAFYENEKLVADYQKIVETFFKELKKDNAKTRAEKVVSFEKTLAKKFPSSSDFRNLIVADTVKSRKDLIKDYPNLPMAALLSQIPESTQIRDLTADSAAEVNRLLETTDAETLQSVFMFLSLKDVLDDAYPKFQKELFAFSKKHLGGPASRPPRDERCTNAASANFAFEIDEYLTPILFPNFPRQKVIDLVGDVRNTLLEKIKRNSWISSSGRKEAIEKMKSAPLFLVQPTTEREWDFNPIMDYSATDSIGNALKLKEARNRKLLEELKADRIRERWGYGPLVLNAYYSPTDNQFVLLQGILQSPFYDPNQSEIENYAAIGSVVGHELGHGIDDKGALYNSKGELKQWMTANDLAEFKKRGDQFVKRFNDVGHNGSFTLGENIGDHVGITTSYETVTKKFPNMTQEDKQKFFKSYAKLWCNVTRPEFEQKLLKTDPHSLGRERINQQVKHVDGFYEAFNCKPNDKMYVAPEDRIKVW